MQILPIWPFDASEIQRETFLISAGLAKSFKSFKIQNFMAMARARDRCPNDLELRSDDFLCHFRFCRFQLLLVYCRAVWKLIELDDDLPLRWFDRVKYYNDRGFAYITLARMPRKSLIWVNDLVNIKIQAFGLGIAASNFPCPLLSSLGMSAPFLFSLFLGPWSSRHLSSVGGVEY